MPKRLCPFGDEFLPQIKTFVTEKKFNSGQIERMLAVHEKTKKLLFSGANNRCHCNGNHQRKSEDDFCSPTCTYCQDKIRLYFEKVKARCYVCSEPSQNKCTYCDKLLCKECELCCYQCDLIFCKNCTFTVFKDKLDDSILCYSCFA